MLIPRNITREHILQAVVRIKSKGVPAARKQRCWAINYEGDIYPCKLLISLANIYANGKELDPDPDNFQTDMARNYLTNLGFKVIKV